MKKLRDLFGQTKLETLWGRYKEHLSEIEQKINFARKKIVGCPEKFKQFYEKLERNLRNPEFVMRSAQRYTIAEVPPFFAFGSMRERFLNSWIKEFSHFGAPIEGTNRREIHSGLYNPAAIDAPGTKILSIQDFEYRRAQEWVGKGDRSRSMAPQNLRGCWGETIAALLAFIAHRPTIPSARLPATRTSSGKASLPMASRASISR